LSFSGQKKGVAIAVGNVSGRLVEAGGMAERGRLEALRGCMMSGVTVPPWRSRLHLASGKVGNKSGRINSGVIQEKLQEPRARAKSSGYGIARMKGFMLSLRLNEWHIILLENIGVKGAPQTSLIEPIH
jgi:hypothetical protein